MEVNYVWSTQDAEHLIVKMARVSAPKNANNMETAPRLLRYLIKQKHWSPFEMANLCLEIQCPRAISQQIIRHRSFSFQEFSQRYANVNEIGRINIPHLRAQDNKNRQNSLNDLEQRLGSDVVSDFYRRIQTHMEDAEHLYQEMVSAGVAKECARAILPLNSTSKLFMNGTLRSWIHYLELRTDPSTQLEHREVALKCRAIFENNFPVISETLWNLSSSK